MRDKVSAEQIAVLEVRQCGRCAICATPVTRERGLQVDHCHKSGDVRGLLCAACNLGLGQFRDDPKLLQAAIEYLKNGFMQPAIRAINIKPPVKRSKRNRLETGSPEWLDLQRLVDPANARRAERIAYWKAREARNPC